MKKTDSIAIKYLTVLPFLLLFDCFIFTNS